MATRQTRCCRAAGHRVRRQREWPAGLTGREVEVLRLVTLGLSNREIAERLIITRKTAGNHVEHVYAKIGASNRARAALFAMQHGLMSDYASPALRACGKTTGCGDAGRLDQGTGRLAGTGRGQAARVELGPDHGRVVEQDEPPGERVRFG